MARYLLLTETELSYMRAAVRTAMEEDCGVRIFRQYENLMVKVNNARKATGKLRAAIKKAEGK